MTTRLPLASLAATLALAAAAATAGAALLGVSGWFLTATALAGSGAALNLALPSAFVRGLSLVRIVSRYGERLVGHAATLSLLERLREGLFRRLVPLAPFDGSSHRRGDLVSRLTGDVGALDSVFVGGVAPTLAALIAAVSFTIVLAWVLPEAALPFATAFVIAGLLPLALLTVMIWGDGAEIQDRQAKLRSTLLETIDGHADLVACGATGRASIALANDVSALAKAGRRRDVKAAVGTQSSQLVAGATTLMLLSMALAAHAEDRLSGALVVGLLLGALATLEAAAGLTRNAGRLAAAGAAARRLRRRVSCSRRRSDPERPIRITTPVTLAFERVSMRRRPERRLLDGATISIRPGETVAILGASGAGKSTFFDLALGLLEPERGRILIGGVDVRDLAAADLFRHVALLEQHAPIFLGSVRDNLRMGCADADDGVLWSALRAARIDVFVEMLPGQLDAWLGEGGRTLSAGQARRFCLARILLSPADILLLDEPTSGLDRDNESAFLRDLAAATAGRTVLIATHAELPLGCIDRVVTLVDGRLCPVAPEDPLGSSTSSSPVQAVRRSDGAIDRSGRELNEKRMRHHHSG